MLKIEELQEEEGFGALSILDIATYEPSGKVNRRIKTYNLTKKTDEMVITLKEITDLISVQHSKAMVKIEELQKEEGFGLLSKMDISIPRGNGALPQTITTYNLTKKQAIAVGARLNNKKFNREKYVWVSLHCI